MFCTVFTSRGLKRQLVCKKQNSSFNNCIYFMINTKYKWKKKWAKSNNKCPPPPLLNIATPQECKYALNTNKLIQGITCQKKKQDKKPGLTDGWTGPKHYTPRNFIAWKLIMAQLAVQTYIGRFPNWWRLWTVSNSQRTVLNSLIIANLYMDVCFMIIQKTCITLCFLLSNRQPCLNGHNK